MRFLRQENGASAVEFALVVPFLLTLVMAVVVYGMYFGATHSVQQLAADAARASVAGLADDEECASRAEQHVAVAAGSYPLLDAEKIVVNAAPLADDPNVFSVAISYDASDLPIWMFENFLPLPSKTIARTSVVLRGGYQDDM